MEVNYPNGVKVNLGCELKPEQVKCQPEKINFKAESGAFYTIYMGDPDAPSKCDPKDREWQHFLVGNVPGTDICKGDVLTEYIGALPPKGTDLHRYVYLAFKQCEKVCFKEKKINNKTISGRGKFSIRDFAKKYKLGEPVAGTFFLAQWESYVDKAMKELGC